MGDYAKAEPLYQRALKINEKALGPEHPDTAKSLNNLALLYDKMGDYAKAEPLYQRALKIREKRSALNTHSPRRASTIWRCFILEWVMPKKRYAWPRRLDRLKKKICRTFCPLRPSSSAWHFRRQPSPTLCPPPWEAPRSSRRSFSGKKAWCSTRLLEDRLVAEASGDPKQRAIVDELRSAKQRLTKLVMEVPEDLSEEARQKRDAEKEKLSAQVEQLEGGLARQVAGLGRARRALSVTVPQVQSALPQQAALIELLRYSHYLGKDKYEPRYGAIVIGAKGEPGWVPLGGAAEIEKNVALYQKSVRGKRMKRH